MLDDDDKTQEPTIGNNDDSAGDSNYILISPDTRAEASNRPTAIQFFFQNHPFRLPTLKI